MNLSTIVLVLVGWALAILCAVVLMRMVLEQDRDARHEKKRLDPFADVTITQTGSG